MELKEASSKAGDGGRIYRWNGGKKIVKTISMDTNFDLEDVRMCNWEVLQDTIEVGDVVRKNNCTGVDCEVLGISSVGSIALNNIGDRACACHEVERGVNIKAKDLTLIRKGPKRYEKIIPIDIQVKDINSFICQVLTEFKFLGKPNFKISVERIDD